MFGRISKKTIVLGAAFIFAGLFFLFSDKAKAPVFTDISIGEISVHAEIANTAESRTRGLSGRNGLLENEGTLFVFEKEGRYSFWMKDMKFPIDIIWIDKDGTIVYIKENAEPDSYPETFIPDAPAQYVLEVNKNFISEYGISAGDKVGF